MERLTEYDEFGNADIIALAGVMQELYEGLSFNKTNALTDVLDHLAAYEDTGLTPQEITNLQKQAENKPLTLDELREMAWSQSPVWCRDFDGLHTGLLCIKDDLFGQERTPHVWLLDEEGNSGVYSVNSLLKCGAEFYRRRPEEDAP